MRNCGEGRALLQINNMVREFLGVMKDFLVGEYVNTENFVQCTGIKLNTSAIWYGNGKEAADAENCRAGAPEF